MAVQSHALVPSDQPVTLIAKLTGRAEVDPTGPRKGRGRAKLVITANAVPTKVEANGTIIVPAQGRICWQISVQRVGKAIAAQIYEGVARINGRVAVNLATTSRQGLPSPYYHARGCTLANSDVVKMILAHPGQYYVNVKTGKYLFGAVRGQLRRISP
jgi:hypothetical protein